MYYRSVSAQLVIASLNCCVPYFVDGAVFPSRGLYFWPRSGQSNTAAGLASCWLYPEREPRQLGEWRVVLINTIRMCSQIPPRKIAKTKSIISNMLTSNHVIIRDIAKIAGFINSLYLAVGPATRLFTRQMHFAIMPRNSWIPR